MKVTRIEATVVIQPLMDRDWKFARGQLSQTAALLLQVQTDDGISGLGFAVQGLHLGEVLHGMEQVVSEQVAPLLVGRDPFDTEWLMTELGRRVPGYTRTKAAVETALFDVMGKALGVPVYKLLGGKVRSSIPVIRILPIKAPAEMAANAEAVVREGFRYLKIKVGTDPVMDVERVKAIRHAVGPEIGLTIDANQGWMPKEALTALSRMEPYDVAIVEQPVAADDYAGLALVKANTHSLVEADESAGTLADVFRLAAAGCVDAISLKPGRLGGLLATKKAAALCEAANLHARIGMAGASRLCAAADMHVIASTPNISYACELAEFTRMESDPAEGLEIVNGEISVPEAPGIGVALRGR
jgi:L-alanine-DL-glutamate epimerase-like enolase superfamily enzyme